MKRRIFLGIGVVFIAVIAVVYHSAFPIRADGSNLKEHINRFYNRGYSVELSIHTKLYDSVVLEKTKYVLVEINDQIGIVTLIQGITGNYKIDNLSYGDGNFREWIADSGDKKYLFFGGRNIGSEIARISYQLEDRNYDMKVPNQTRFLISQEIDDQIQSTHLNLDSLKFYNDNGEDITRHVDWNGLS